MWERKYRNATTDPVNHRLFGIWNKMLKRCENSKESRYKDYGARGIKVCEEWHDFDVFADWAKANGYAEKLTIERKDVDKGYNPDNCTWITLAEQSLNTRQTVWIEYKGERKPLVTFCKELGLNYDVTHDRIRDKGWSVEKAFETPVYDASDSFARKCRELGVPEHTVYDRIHKLGWSEEKAFSTPFLGKHVGHWVPEEHPRKCLVCGADYLATNFKQKYCSPKCHAESKHVWFKRKQEAV